MNLSFFLREVYFNMKRNPLMNAASVSTIMILVMILGIFLLLAMNLNHMAENVLQQLQITARLSPTLKNEQIQELKKKIILIPEVSSAEFVSKDEAFRRLQKNLGRSISISDVGVNPLPNYFEVSLKSPREIELVAGRISKLPGVETVRYGQDLSRKIISVSRVVYWTGAVLIILLLISTLFIVSNTIRLTVFARRREIRIMQLVGAANWFIRWPFVIEGMLQGLGGALLSVFLINLFYPFLADSVKNAFLFIPILPPELVIPRLTALLLTAGILTGAAGSIISVNKFLHLA
jgi:cell division transport system permease protein